MTIVSVEINFRTVKLPVEPAGLSIAAIELKILGVIIHRRECARMIMSEDSYVTIKRGLSECQRIRVFSARTQVYTMTVHEDQGLCMVLTQHRAHTVKRRKAQLVGLFIPSKRLQNLDLQPGHDEDAWIFAPESSDHLLSALSADVSALL